MIRASIVIPTFNRLDLLIRCINSIRAHTHSPYELIVVDNGSADGTIEWCAYEKIPFISYSDNKGFPVACNQGLRLSSGDTLVLLNNDTVVSPRWLDILTEALYSAPDVGIVGPVTNYASGAQQVDYPFDGIDQFQAVAENVNRLDPSKWQSVERVVGLCFGFRRELMDRIGLLDERFSPGHYEDDDYCLRAKLQGYRLLVCGDCFIYHEGSASFKQGGLDNHKRLVERNFRIFREKWQRDPRISV